MGSQQARTYGQLGKPVGLAVRFAVPTKERRSKKGGEARGLQKYWQKAYAMAPTADSES